MDIRSRKAVKKSKITRKPEEIRNWAIENGHKAEKSSKKVQNHPRARGKYGTGQEKMDIRPRNSKKVQNHSEARGKYGTGQEKMDIRPRKTVKKSKIIRKLERKTQKFRWKGVSHRNVACVLFYLKWKRNTRAQSYFSLEDRATGI